jgi:predicted TIM-barrel fold metal-dependent hydrolase
MAYTTISGDGHIDLKWLPHDLFVSNAPAKWKDQVPHAVETPQGKHWFAEGRDLTTLPFGTLANLEPPVRGVSKHTDRMYALGFFDGAPHPTTPELRIKDQQIDGIDAEVIYGILGISRLLTDRELLGVVYEIYNTWAADFCRTTPERFVALACLPSDDPQRAAAELRRTAKLGLKGADFAVSTAVKPIWHCDWEPLWAAASSLDAPIIVHEAYVHGIDTIAEDRAANYAAAHVMAHPFEQMASMTATAVSGILNRHPKLRIGFFEAGCTWAPYLQQRIEEHYEHMPSEFGGDPTGLLNKRSWVTFEVEEWGVQLAAQLGWENNIVFASDFPHFDAQFPGAVKMILERGFGPKLERKLLFDNALGFYGERLERRIAPALKEK